MPNRLPDPSSGIQPSTLTTTGDILYASSAQVAARLAIGSTNQALGVTGGVPAYQASSKSTLTTTGDIIYASAANTPERLGIGSSAQVLTVASGIPSWATPAAAASGLTLITRASFASVASTTTTFDNVFTSTYTQYIIRMETMGGAAGSEILQMQFRYAGPTTQTTDYYSAAIGTTSAASTIIWTAQFAGSTMDLAADVGETTQPAGGVINVSQVGNSSQKPLIYGSYGSTGYVQATVGSFGGGCDTARTYTGFLLKLNTGNITGTVSVYGMAKA